MQEKEQKKKFHFPFQGEFQWKNFFRLPMWIRTLIISGASLVLLTAVFFMAGNYLYSPQKVARDYYERCCPRIGTGCMTAANFRRDSSCPERIL